MARQPGRGDARPRAQPANGRHFPARFTAPEFTSLCPVTGQPDFGHLVIDYVPGQWLLESKSLKLYLASFRNHGAFHQHRTVTIGKRITAEIKPKWLAHRRLLVSARRHPDRRVLANRRLPKGMWLPDQGGAPIAAGAEPSPVPALRSGGTSQKCHVWTAPGWQELFSHFAALVGAAMCSAF